LRGRSSACSWHRGDRAHAERSISGTRHGSGQPGEPENQGDARLHRLPKAARGNEGSPVRAWERASKRALRLPPTALPRTSLLLRTA
jgi:hypothetical protein